MRLIDGEPLSAPATLPATHRAQLAGREDLAKHLVLSGALAVMFQDRFSQSAGEWKELNDSLPGGSGFSFVDLAADRAGVRLAASADTPESARAIARALARADEAALFGIRAPERFAEGLSAKQFEQGFGSVASPQFRRKLELIDASLEQLPLYRLTRRPAL